MRCYGKGGEVADQMAGDTTRNGVTAPLRLGGDPKTLTRILVACGLCYIALIALFIALLALMLSVSSDLRIESSLREGVKIGLLSPDDLSSPYGDSVGMNDECL